MHDLYNIHNSIASNVKDEVLNYQLVPHLFHVCNEKWHEKSGHPCFSTSHNTFRQYVPDSSISNKVSDKAPYLFSIYVNCLSPINFHFLLLLYVLQSILLCCI